MPNDLEDVDLSCYSLHVGLILDLIFLQDFNSHLLTSDKVRTQSYFSECSLTKGSTCYETQC